MPQITAGDVIHVTAQFAQPKKLKYLICVDPARFKYLVVNTDPYLLAPTAQFKLNKVDLALLDHDSYVDTSKLVTLSAMENQYVVDADPACLKGALSLALRQQIKTFTAQHGIMQKDQMKIIDGSF